MEASKTEIKEPKQEIKAVYVSKEKKNPWIIYTVVLAIAVVILAFLLYRGSGVTGNAIDKDKAGQKVIDWVGGQVQNTKLISVNESDGFYDVLFSYTSPQTGSIQESTLKVTLDGKYLILQAIPLEETPANTKPDTTSETTPAEVPKSDKPKVELFVMTECPYGTQAEKGIIPVLELFGSKIDGQISFVHYFMHGDKEEEETYRQVCIREEQSDKYLTYLKCYLADGNATRCIKEAKISETKLKSCISKSSEAYYKADSAASEAAGVQGSPTLVINGQIVNSGRSPSAFLQTICSAFNTAPEGCSETLDSTNPSAGFGYSASGSASSASCG